MSIQEEIKEVQEEIKNTPYNKATSHHIGRLKAKLARLRDEAERKESGKSKGGGYSVKRSGDATVSLVGFPSVGKSTILNKLTGAQSEVAEYEFTTLEVIPGVLEYKGAKIQMLDVPGLVKGAASGRGRGKEVISVIRNSHLVVFVLDVFQTYQYDVLKQELYDAGVRVDENPPDVAIKRMDRGGIIVDSTVDLDYLSVDTIKAVLGEYKIHNAHVLIRENITVDQLIDAVLENRVYIPGIPIINKVDLGDEGTLEYCVQNFPEAIMISADQDMNIEGVKEGIFSSIDFIRIYMKPQGESADLQEPMIIRKDSTVEDVCERLHRDFKKKFRYARVWGSSAKHPGQRAGLDHVLHDEDILSLIIQK